jgi:hypothetical protein
MLISLPTLISSLHPWDFLCPRRLSLLQVLKTGSVKALIFLDVALKH